MTGGLTQQVERGRKRDTDPPKKRKKKVEENLLGRSGRTFKRCRPGRRVSRDAGK